MDRYSAITHVETFGGGALEDREKKMQNRSLILLAMMGGLCATTAQAAFTGTQFDSNTAFSGAGEIAPATNDLLTGLIESGSVFHDQEGLNTDTTASSLTNGAFGPAGLIKPSGPNPEVAIIGNGQTLTYTLGAGPNGLGYTISEFRAYSGWADTGRSRQDFGLTYSTVADPNTFIPLTTFNGAANAQDELTVIKDASGATIPGVFAVQFTTTGGNVQNGYVGYREFDLIGAATTPEPASLGLLGISALSLLARRRRSRRALI
jgi:hypothetical protein